MRARINKPCCIVALGIAAILGLTAGLSRAALAQVGPNAPKPRQFTKFYGLVKRVPLNGTGLWVIGLETLDSDQFTELDEYHGPLAFGACARVEMRQGRARRIASARSEACLPPARTDKVLH
jgi:hypothetical protein